MTVLMLMLMLDEESEEGDDNHFYDNDTIWKHKGGKKHKGGRHSKSRILFISFMSFVILSVCHLCAFIWDINARGVLFIHIYFDLVLKSFKQQDYSLSILNINVQIFVWLCKSMNGDMYFWSYGNNIHLFNANRRICIYLCVNRCLH
jgi:hypothetical protein